MVQYVWNGQQDPVREDEEEKIPSYISRLTQTELLTPHEENELALLALAGNEEARKRLVEANMRLVVNIAKHYRNHAIPFEDLVQEGAIGLMNAISRFDPDKGYRFSTYATHWIRQSIGRALDNKSKAIRLPAHVSETLRRIIKEKARLLREMGEDPDPEQLAQACGVSTGKIVRLLQSSQEPLSLDMMVGDEENAALGSFLSDSTVSNPEEMILKLEFQTEVEEIFASLSERERMIIRRRLGLDSTESNVLQDIGTDLQLSRERIRQIEASAIKKLRTLANRRRLRDKYVS